MVHLIFFVKIKLITIMATRKKFCIALVTGLIIFFKTSYFTCL